MIVCHTSKKLLTAVPFGSKSGSLGFFVSGVTTLFTSFLGSTFLGGMLKARQEKEFEESCETRQKGTSSGGFYIHIQIPQAKTRGTNRTLWDTTMNHTRSGDCSTEWQGSALLALQGEYQHVHTLFSPRGAWVNGMGIRVALWDGGMVS